MARLRGTKNWSLPEKSLVLAVEWVAEVVPRRDGVYRRKGGQMFPWPCEGQEGFIKASRTASVCQLGNGLVFCVLVTLQRNCSWVSGQH